jgi:hypothetical protein
MSLDLSYLFSSSVWNINWVIPSDLSSTSLVLYSAISSLKISIYSYIYYVLKFSFSNYLFTLFFYSFAMVSIHSFTYLIMLNCSFIFFTAIDFSFYFMLLLFISDSPVAIYLLNWVLNHMEKNETPLGNLSCLACDCHPHWHVEVAYVGIWQTLLWCYGFRHLSSSSNTDLSSCHSSSMVFEKIQILLQ